MGRCLLVARSVRTIRVRSSLQLRSTPRTIQTSVVVTYTAECGLPRYCFPTIAQHVATRFYFSHMVRVREIGYLLSTIHCNHIERYELMTRGLALHISSAHRFHGDTACPRPQLRPQRVRMATLWLQASQD